MPEAFAQERSERHSPIFLQPIFAAAGVIAGWYVGCSIDDNYGNGCAAAVVGGALIGYGSWAAIDIAFIAYTDKPKPARAAGVLQVGLLPLPGGVDARLSGSF